MNSPPVRVGDAEAFDDFALSVHSLVGMLRSLECEKGYELKCGSHVDRLLVKLPASYRDASPISMASAEITGKAHFQQSC